MHMNKKAQLEDIYWDLIIGIILILITALIIGHGIEGSNTKVNYWIFSGHGPNLADIALVNLLRTPINKTDSVLAKDLKNHNINFGYEIFQFIGNNYPNVNEQDKWAFNLPDYFLKHNYPNPSSCGSEFVYLLNKYFNGNLQNKGLNDNSWIIKMYKSKSKTLSEDKEIFHCENIDENVLLDNVRLGLSEYYSTNLTVPLNDEEGIIIDLILGVGWQQKKE